MRRRVGLFLLVAVGFSVLLAGCGNDPDNLYKKGKYQEAYPEFMKRGGTNEAALRREEPNGSVTPRNNAGNQAIHDYYYAADCQRKLGNKSEAEGLFRRVVELSQYEIRIPNDRSAELKSAMERLQRALYEMRTQEQSYGRELREWENRPPENTDPWSGGSTGGSNTDPWAGGSTGGSTGGSNTDPWAGGSTGGSTGGSNTDPWSGGSTGGSNTDPWSNRAPAPSTRTNRAADAEPPSQYWLRAAYDSVTSARRDFERLLYTTTKAEIPDIDNLKSEWDRTGRLIDNYCMYAAPSGLLFRPDSLVSRLAWDQLQGSWTTLSRKVYEAKGNVTYTVHKLTLKEPQLVEQAKAALREMGIDPNSIGKAATSSTAGSTKVNVNTTGTNPFGQ